MKKHLLIKALLVFVVLLTSSAQAWAWDCGWWDTGSGELKFDMNGTEKSLGTVDRNHSSAYSDLNLGTVTSKLEIKKAWGKTWGKEGGGSFIYSMWLYYRVKEQDAASSTSYSEYQISWKNDFDGSNSYWEKDINVCPINGLTPGNYEIEYYMKVYPKNDHYVQYADFNNCGSNFHANFTIPSKNLTIATDDTHGNTVSGSVTGVAKGTPYTITATPIRGYRFKRWTATSGGSSVTIADASSATTTVTFNNFSNNVTIKAEFEVKWVIKGTMSNDGWSTAYELGNATGSTRSGTITLAAGTHQFKIWNRDGGNPYGCSANITSSVYEYNFYDDGSTPNCSITVVTAGTYNFNWDEDNHQLTVIYPDLTSKKILAKNTILYFDARNANTTGWKNADFTARFWFKYYDSGLDHGSVDCAKSNALGVAWMYYATVPNNDYIGRVQMNRMKPSSETIWCSAYIDYAYERTNGDENCLAIKSDDASKCGSFRPEWTYYRPPMSSAALTNDGTQTVTYGGDGGSSTPYLVATGSSIYVTATSTSAVADNQMTPYYQFKKEGSNDGGESSTYTHTYTASETTGTKEAMTVVARNKYHNDYGTASPASTAVYYEARTPFSVTTPTLSHVTKTAGATGAGATVYGAVYNATFARTTGYDLPATITVTNGGSPLTVTTDYTWNSSTGALQIKANKITGNVAISITGVAKTTSLTLDPNKDNHGTGSNVAVTATFADELPSFAAAVGATGYELEGYYTTASVDGEKIINANGTLVRNTTYSTDEETPKWNSEVSSLTLYARYTLINYNVTYNAPTNGDYTINVASAGASSASKTATMGQTVALVATPVNKAYYFTGWTITNTDASSDVTSTLLPTSATSASTSFTMPAYNISIAATFAPRFALEGSLYDDSSDAGMPGWDHGDAADFAVVGYTGLDNLGVNLRCTLTTIHPNKKYKFRVYDREKDKRLGATSADYELAANASVQLSVEGEDPANNVVINTVGYGTYIFHITKLSSTNYYPTIEVIRQSSSQLTLGWKHYTANSLEDGDLGGTVTAVTNEGSGFDIADGQYYANGSTLTFTASPAEGYHVEGWYSDASCSSAYTSGEGGATISGEGNVTLVLSSVGTNKTVYVKFAEESNIFNATIDNCWDKKGNWSENRVPKRTDVVYINAPVNVDTQSAKAKRVIIYNDGTNDHTGKLTVNAGQKLIVAETIQKNDGSSLVATTENDLVINSDGTNGVGALVWGKASTSPGAATVNFYSVSGGSKGSTASVNQFIGTPFTSETSDWLYNYYNSWVLGVNYTGTPTFYLLGSNDSMEPFQGYCIIYNGSTGHTYNMSGTLVANADHTCTSLSYHGGTAANIDNENLLANPWLAPMKIDQMEDAFSTEVDPTIYIFNSTSKSGYTGMGNYSTYTPETAGGSDVIPAMQSFSVFTSNYDGYVTLDYSKIVYDPAVDGTNPVANKAPKRIGEEDANKLRLYVKAESGYGDMIYMWERSDFIEGYDRAWDGRKIAGDKEAPQFYAITPDGNMSVNCVPNFEGTVMGFKAGTEDNTYTFSFEYNNEDDALYLYDIDENKYTRILEGNTYTFSTTDKTEHNRFILTRNMPQSPTNIENVAEKANGAVKFFEDGKLFIFRNGRLYDATGLLVK